MLLEIDCDAFKKDRPTPITFTDGLNIVLGEQSDKNSIGKSTFLLIIDFAFGGTDYIRLAKDVMREEPGHVIKFAFKFAENTRWFSRSTSEPGVVHECDSAYQPLYEMPLSDFNDMLARLYGTSDIGITWRQTVSGSFRVWQRNNYDTMRPLSTFRSDTLRGGITRLIALFNDYMPLKAAIKSEEDAKLAVKGAESTSKYFEFQIAQNRRGVEENEAEIARLKRERDALLNASDSGQESQLTAQEALALAEIKNKKSSLLRRRTLLTNQLDSLSVDEELGDSTKIQHTFEPLLEFFPEIDLARLEKIESFHKGIKKILKTQVKKTRAELTKELEQTTALLADLDRSYTNITAAPTPSAKALYAYHDLESRISQLERENERYGRIEHYKEERSEAERVLKEESKTILKNVQRRMNRYMKEIDGQFTDNERNAPTLTLNSVDSYSFEIVNDSGTGSGQRSLIAFDMALLCHTLLPSVIEDSFLFKQIEKPAVERILKFLAAIKGKQVFIALDELERYSDETQTLILAHTCLKLGKDEEALFGREWGKAS